MTFNLTTNNWHKFTVGDLFDIQQMKCPATEQLIEGNDVPYIAAKKSNNGMQMMCDRNENSSFISAGNCIVFIQQGQGSAGYALYQETDFIGLQGTTACGYNENLNVYNGLFIVSVLDLQRPKYSFGRGWNGERLKNTEIKLPADKSGKPDWQFMESKMKKIFDEISNKVTSNSYSKSRVSFTNTDTWHWFDCAELFAITGTKSFTKTDIKEYGDGNYPYVCTSSLNNGVDGLYATFTEEGNVLTVDSATVGSVFFQNKNFSASDHVEKLIPKFAMNSYIAMFLCAVLNLEKVRYSYGRKFSQARLSETKIKLPADKNGEPNWQFMEDYVKSLPYSANL